MIRLVGIAKGLDRKINEQDEVMDLQATLQSYIEEVDRVADELRDLEQFVAGGIDRYEDETGDLRVSQLRNQASRYIQTAERNLDGLYKSLQRAQKGNV
jgi:vacuolar-type H+-ATPase subunit I/STV1